MLAKVKSVTETSGGYQVTYENAELKDAFKTIDIPESYIPINNYVERVVDAAGNDVKFSRAPSTRASGQNTWEIVLPEKGWSLGLKELELTPKMSLDLAMRYVMQYADYEIDYANFKMDAEMTVGADLALELESAKLLDKKIDLVTVYFAAIPVGPIVITPYASIRGIFKIDGKVTLEASISYTAPVAHAQFKYQKNQGIDANIEFEEEKDDALQFTFGPKFEGGVSYGLSVGASLGIYGKTFSLGGDLDFCKKLTISGKLDITAFTGTGKQWLTPYSLPNPSEDTKNILAMLDYAKKWEFQQFEGFMYNEAATVQLVANCYLAWKKLFDIKIPELSIPIASYPIMPQVKIDEKDLFAFDKNDVTLTLHHPKRSVLDDLTEYRAVFKRKGAKPDEQPITKYFDFDDEKRNLLIAEVKNADVTSKAKATLNGEDSYDITIYMTVLDVDIPIFEGYAKYESGFRTDPSSITVNIKLGLKGDGNATEMIYDGLTNGRTLYWSRLYGANEMSATTTSGGGMNVTGSNSISYDDGNKGESKISFNVGAPKDDKFGNLTNLVISHQWSDSWGGHRKWSLTATELPNWETTSGVKDPTSSYATASWHGDQDFKTLKVTSLEYEEYQSAWSDKTVKKYSLNVRDNDYVWVSVGYSKP